MRTARRGLDGGQERPGELLQLRRADAVDLCEFGLAAGAPAHHVDQRAVAKHDVGRNAALARALQIAAP